MPAHRHHGRSRYGDGTTSTTTGLACHNYVPDEFFPTGGGGGVSSFWPLPFYQHFVAGMQRTQPGQEPDLLSDSPSTDGAQDLIDAAGRFRRPQHAGLSLNADPETGYIVVDCTDFPTARHGLQLRGGRLGRHELRRAAVERHDRLDRSGGRRPRRTAQSDALPLGSSCRRFWLCQEARSTTSPRATTGSTHGVRGYDDGAGIGTLNVANLAYRLHDIRRPTATSVRKPLPGSSGKRLSFGGAFHRGFRRVRSRDGTSALPRWRCGSARPRGRWRPSPS